MKRLVKILLSQNSLTKALGLGNFFAATKFNHHLNIIDDFDFSNVLILSPHPDDEIFGLGGTMSKLIKSGANLSVVYFCDGGAGIPQRNPKELIKRIDKEEIGDKNKSSRTLVNIRKDEAQKGAEVLGYKNQIFFGYEDGHLAVEASAVKALTDLILGFKPDIIFVPSFLDNHPDHRAVNEILINTLSKNHLKIQIWAYEVWTPIFPNRIVDITKETDLKKKAIATQVSQLKSRGYDKAILGLNQYRAEINGLKGFAEGFFATTPEIYKKLYRAS